MPVAYISIPPHRRGVLPKIEADLYEQGYSTSVPPMRWTERDSVDPERPDPMFVQACLECLRRAEVLVCVDGWEECELCRIEHKFATDNNIVIRETEDGRVDVPDPPDFTEKWMRVNISHGYFHCHRSKSAGDWS